MAGRALAAALAIACGAASGAAAASFSDLPGWTEDAAGEAFRPFLASCRAILDDLPPSRPAQPPGAALKAVCARAIAGGPLDDAAARAFFESEFQPKSLGEGTLTGYYEPEIPGSLVPTARFDTPLLRRPDDLVTIADGETAPGLAPGLGGARRTPNGLEPYFDRAAIEDGALAGRSLELVYVERVDAFFVHIQGSTRVRLPDGRALRLAFDGRNGRPFSGIGRLLLERGAFAKGEASMAGIRAWLAAHPAEGRAVMRENASYIFFRLDDALKPEDGPRGAQNVPLAPSRSMAVDRGIWSYGLPFWIDGRLPDGAPIRRLVIAQDTGSAILGSARGDYFVGTGDAAGAIAGGMKRRTGFTVLVPRDDAP